MPTSDLESTPIVATAVFLDSSTDEDLSVTCLSFSDEAQCCYGLVSLWSSLDLLITVSLDIGIFFPTIECHFVKWMQPMRDFPSSLYYLTGNCWTIGRSPT